jgi:hypothetical protein
MPPYGLLDGLLDLQYVLLIPLPLPLSHTLDRRLALTGLDLVLDTVCHLPVLDMSECLGGLERLEALEAEEEVGGAFKRLASVARFSCAAQAASAASDVSSLDAFAAESCETSESRLRVLRLRSLRF